MPAHQLHALLVSLTLAPKNGKIGWEGTVAQFVLANINVMVGEMLYKVEFNDIWR